MLHVQACPSNVDEEVVSSRSLYFLFALLAKMISYVSSPLQIAAIRGTFE